MERLAASTPQARRRPARSWPVRSALFAAGYFAVFAILTVWRIAAIDLPSRFSARFRESSMKERWNATIRGWSWTMMVLARSLLGFRVSIEGRVPEEPCLVVANHQALADIVVLMDALRPLAIKPVVLPWLATSFPTVSHTVRNAGFGVVDLDAPDRVLEQVVAFARELPSWNGSPLIYPEGRRSEDGSMSAFRKAGLQLLVRTTRLPVLPVVVDGLWEARHFQEMPKFLPCSRVSVRILEPIPADEARSGLRDLPERLEERMRAELDAIRGQDHGPSTAANSVGP